MAKSKKEEHKLSPQEYREMLRNIELEDIFLEECSAKVRRNFLSKPMKVSIKEKPIYNVQDDSMILIDHSYELIASSDSKKEFALKILCLYKLKYKTGSSVTPEFMDIFVKRNVPLNTWPYFREFVQSMTQRMNLPSLTLPLLK